jgi:6-phosphogluconolactonase (cycloisomerase 2 family)
MDHSNYRKRSHDPSNRRLVARSHICSLQQRGLGRGKPPDFDPIGRFLYCCNQRGDNVAVFRVDRQSGGLHFTGHYTPVGNPSCIVFVDLTKAG